MGRGILVDLTGMNPQAHTSSGKVGTGKCLLAITMGGALDGGHEVIWFGGSVRGSQGTGACTPEKLMSERPPWQKFGEVISSKIS
jgi:hypothetical protein